jgi:hypothetical protein
MFQTHTSIPGLSDHSRRQRPPKSARGFKLTRASPIFQTTAGGKGHRNRREVSNSHEHPRSFRPQQEAKATEIGERFQTHTSIPGLSDQYGDDGGMVPPAMFQTHTSIPGLSDVDFRDPSQFAAWFQTHTSIPGLSDCFSSHFTGQHWYRFKLTRASPVFQTINRLLQSLDDYKVSNSHEHPRSFRRYTSSDDKSYTIEVSNSHEHPRSFRPPEFFTFQMRPYFVSNSHEHPRSFRLGVLTSKDGKL